MLDDLNSHAIVVIATSADEARKIAEEYENNEYLGECNWLTGAVCIEIKTETPKVILRA